MRIICIFLSFLISCVVSYVVTPVTQDLFVKPFNPDWDPVNQRLCMADYADGLVLCYYPDENKFYSSSVPGITTPWFLVRLKRQPGRYLTSNNHSVTEIEWDGRSPTARIVRDRFTLETDPQYASHSIDIAKASPQGNFYGGTIRQTLCADSQEASAAAYSYNRCRGVKKIIPDLKIFGGIEWSPKGDKFYAIDSCRMVIREYKYNGKTGKISNGCDIFHYKGQFGDPTSFMIGLTGDTKGNLYVPIYMGGVVLKVDPRTGEILQVIIIPGKVVAGVAFGGKHMDTLFVTTFSKARATYTGDTISTEWPNSGFIYAVTGLGAKGFPGREACV